MNKALLDTDILSEISKAIDPTVVRNAAAYRKAWGSAVTVMEIVRGLHKKQAIKRLSSFLASITLEEVVPLDQPSAELAGRIAGDLERVGRPIGTADTMIAAMALTQGLDLVTGNTTHFQYVRQVGYPLTLVNWRDHGVKNP